MSLRKIRESAGGYVVQGTPFSTADTQIFNAFYHCNCLENVNLQLHLHLLLWNEKKFAEDTKRRAVAGVWDDWAAIKRDLKWLPEMGGVRRISSSSAKVKCKLLPRGGIILMHRTPRGLVSQEAALQRRLWEIQWVTSWPWASNVPLQHRGPKVSWDTLGGM